MRLNFNIYNFGKYQDIGGALDYTQTPHNPKKNSHFNRYLFTIGDACYISNDFDLLFSFYLLKRNKIYVV